MSEKDTTVYVQKRNGKLYRQHPDGTETEMPVPPPLPAMSNEEIVAAALADPDCPPLMGGDSLHRKQRPRSFVIRRALKVSQEEFSARYGIDLDTIRKWEAYELEPDSAARSLLRLIANDPVGTADSLAGRKRPQAAE